MTKNYLPILAILILLISSTTSFNHILSKFDNEFKNMLHHRNIGDTSKSFSIAMKILVSVQTLKGELEIQEPNVMVVTSDQNQEKTCDQLLDMIVESGNKKDWVNNWEEIYQVIKTLNRKCTNMNFVEKEETLEQAGSLTGGFENKCALCVVLTQILDNYIRVHKKNVTDFIQNQFCSLFDGITKPTCQAFTHYAGPFIINAILKRQNPDRACLSIGWCKNKDCKISKAFIQQNQLQLVPNGDKKPAPWQWLIHIFVDKFGNGHLPPFDLDNDTFSDISTFRGYNWRGADCDQMDKFVYPGRKTGNKIVDNDCNGIFGLNPKTGRTYEHDFCQKSTRLGVAVIGDSAGAHFSIPQKYFNASMIVKGTYNDLLARVANQLDIPHESGYTGYTITHGYTRHSVYKYLREWNLCNHNDYQNVAVNGGDSGNTWGNIKALKRNQKNDYPLLMFLELIGNDVCSKSFDGMTKPADFKEKILKLLNYLDTTVPAGSHLFILGLADGDVLFDNLHDSIHPLNVTYETVYDFLNCLKISPCWGWLNSNETVRKFATERAQNLSKMYQQIITDGTKFKNFDLVYYDFPTWQILQRKITQGGDPKDLIERCDGFHPNGQFHSYLADWIWHKIQTNHAGWVGEKNPHNQEIRRVFGSPVIH